MIGSIVKLGKIANAELDEMFKQTDPDSDDYVTFPMFQLWVYNFKFTAQWAMKLVKGVKI